MLQLERNLEGALRDREGVRQAMSAKDRSITDLEKRVAMLEGAHPLGGLALSSGTSGVFCAWRRGINSRPVEGGRACTRSLTDARCRVAPCTRLHHQRRQAW